MSNNKYGFLYNNDFTEEEVSELARYYASPQDARDPEPFNTMVKERLQKEGRPYPEALINDDFLPKTRHIKIEFDVPEEIADRIEAELSDNQSPLYTDMYKNLLSYA